MWRLEIAEVNDRGSSIAQVHDPGIRSDTHKFDRLKIGQKAEADGFADGIASKKEAVRQAFAHNGDARMLLVVGLVEAASRKQGDAEGIEETRRDHGSIGREMNAAIGIG